MLECFDCKLSSISGKDHFYPGDTLAAQHCSRKQTIQRCSGGNLPDGFPKKRGFPKPAAAAGPAPSLRAAVRNFAIRWQSSDEEQWEAPAGGCHNQGRGALGWPWGQRELWCQICSGRVQFVAVGAGRSAWWEIFHPWVRLSGSHGVGRIKGRSWFMFQGGSWGYLKDLRFQGSFSPAVPSAVQEPDSAVSQSVCGPTGALGAPGM